MQFTATRTRSYDQNGHFVGAINAAPPTTFTIGFFYDKGPISADVNWDHQSGFTAECSQCTEVPGWPAISEPFNWVTASVHYRFGHGFEVYWEGKNLSNSIARTYLNGNPLLPWAPGQNVGGERERRRLWLQRLRPHLRPRPLVALLKRMTLERIERSPGAERGPDRIRRRPLDGA